MRTKSLQQQIDFLSGQVWALSIASHALLKYHPDRVTAAGLVHADIERALSDLLPSGFSDETLHGIAVARDTYLLRAEQDPGQPSRT